MTVLFIFGTILLIIIYYALKPIKPSFHEELVNEDDTNDNIDDLESIVIFDDFLDFDLRGVHLPTKKKYILDNCYISQNLILTPETSKQYKGTAVAVYTEDNFKIGYVPKELSAEILEIIKDSHNCSIEELNFNDDWLEVILLLEFDPV